MGMGTENKRERIMKFDNKFEESFYKRFNDLNLKYITSKKEYNIKLVRPIKRYVPCDFFIEIANRTIALVEVKESIFLDVYDYSKIEKFASENNVRYIVLSDGNKFIITDRKGGLQKATLNFNEFIQLIQEREDVNVEESKQLISETIRSIINESQFGFLKDNVIELISQISNGIEFNEIDSSFSFSNPTDINNIENRIFRLLLKGEKPLTKVYRYTTLSTIFSMLNYNSFRMNCLVGMNDTTEVNYAENYITGTNRDYTQAVWQTVDSYNRRFISSCSLKDDDLTQWRLYADDSKGVCLVLKVDEENLDSKFILKRISYSQKNGDHPELNFIKNIIAVLKNKLNVDFEFKTLSTWRHFFKPFDYAVEEEVRLLFILHDEDIKKGWLLTNSHNILNPYVDFILNEAGLPLKMTEIVLGPKCPEKDINQKQFEQFIRELRKKKKTVKKNDEEASVEEYNIPNLTVSISKIKNYR